MDTRIYEPVGGGKVTMYYTGDFYRTIAPFDIFVDEEMTTAPTNEEFMDAFNSGIVLITIDGTIYTVESVASNDGGSVLITLNTDTSGAKYTIYYVAEASMVPGAELELTEIFVNRSLTTDVTMSEFLSAVNSGTVMLFHTSGAYEYHTTIRQIKRVGNTVTVIPDIEEHANAIVYYISKEEAETSGRARIHKTPEVVSTNSLSDTELENLSDNPYNIWLADIDSKDSSGRMRKYSIADTKYRDESSSHGARWTFYVNMAVQLESGVEGRSMFYFG